MSDSKELSVLRAASQRLLDSDNDKTIEKFCHRAADVAAFEAALKQCSTEHFQAEAAASSLRTDPEQEAAQVVEMVKSLLRGLLTNVLTRNGLANDYQFRHLSWSLDGYSMVARIAKSILSSWCIDKNWIDDENATGNTVLTRAASNGHTSVVELLLTDPRVDKASIDHAINTGWTALMEAAWNGHTSVVELLLADPRVDKASIHHTGNLGHTALWYAAARGLVPVAKLLLSDSRTSWDSIVELIDDRYVMNRDEIRPLIIAELTRQQMCVIYPPANRLLWPVPVQSDAESGDADSSGPADDDEDDDAREDGFAQPECALITSFFQSRVFDVNVLRIIREYATYTV
jgi:Ankyrin repeats (3 copies)/Ankyrin repeat